ncbi:MAG TPA: T9SS type A sorting domain-containing protein, partial [Bacteroidetes bacterium]|nr:T9SS type A sorting domain-containing protein [Bacteroidota bacterium]
AKFMFDVVAVDDDDELDPFLIRGWSPDAGGANFGNMDDAGEAELAGDPPVTYSQVTIFSDNTPPVIDGDISDWDGIDAHAMEYAEGGFTTTAEDYSAYWKAVWNDTMFYAMAKITDDTLYNAGSPFWNHDAINFYVGWDNDRNGEGASNGLHKYLYHHWWGEADDALGFVQDMPDGQVKVVDLADGTGWAIEWSAPFSQMDANGSGFVPEKGAKFLFDVVAVDDDNELDPFLILGWADGAGGGNFGNMDNAGEATLGAVQPSRAVVYSTDTPPAIDGDISDWDNIEGYDLGYVEGGSTQIPSDFSGQWKAVWSNDAIYLMAEINDDTLYNEGMAFWNHDAMNFYFGMDNKRDGTGASNGTHKYLFHHWWGFADDELGGTDGLDGVEVAKFDKADGSGWALEWKIPFSSLDANDFGFVPEEGAKFQFDVVAVDDDDELDPFVIRGWADQSGGTSFVNMDNIGEVTLGGPLPAFFNRTKVYSVSNPPVIDGDYSDWDGIEGHAMNYVEGGSTQTPEDFSGQWKAVWQSDAIYLLAQINDDTLYNEGMAFWNHDAVNFYFGVNNERDGTGASNSMHKYLFHHWWGFADDEMGGTDNLTGVEVAKRNRADGTGWDLEWKIPFDQLDADGFGFVVEEGAKLMFDVVAVDDDDELDPFVIRGWAEGSGGTSFVNMDNIGEIELAIDENPFAFSRTQIDAVNGAVPVIDGDLSDWDGIEAHSMDYVEGGSTQIPSDFSGEWKAVWDNDAFYMLADINDDTLYNEGMAFWNHDALNFYFGVDNDRNGIGAGTAADDHKYLFHHWWGFADDEMGGTADLTGVEVAKRDRADGTGWYIEWKIPFDQLDANGFGLVGEDGTKFMFDVVAVDDDDELDPFVIRGWANGAGGMSFGNMDFAGEVELRGTPLGVNDIDKTSTFRVFPNPVSNELFVSDFDAVQNISLFNMTGQRVLEMKLSGNETQAVLDMNNLAKGFYLLTLTSEKGVATRKVIKQ